MKLAPIAIAAVLAAGIGTAVAQGDVVNQRQTILKTYGAALRDPGAMLRNEAPFDLAKVKATLATFKDGAGKLPPLFPDGSLGGASKAQPLIQAERAQFNAIWTKFTADIAAAETAITNEATFRTEFPKVTANCAACHRPYRAQ
jgi:cytochrome c556